MHSHIRADPVASTLTVDAGKMAIRSVITTDQPDRAGDVVVPTGLRNAEEFLLNPVVLWAHNRSSVPPIGECQWIDIQPHRIVAETRFAQNVPFAEDVFRLYEQGILKGWSIGFIPRVAKRIIGSQPNALKVETWDLLEYSAVPIPENPGALTIAIQKGMIRTRRLREWLAEVPDDRGGRYHRAHRSDVLTELVKQKNVHHRGTEITEKASF
jgi:phage head maturation protease